MEIKLSLPAITSACSLPKSNQIASSFDNEDLYDLDLSIRVTPKLPTKEHLTQGEACSGSCLSCEYTCGNCVSINKRC